MRNTVQSFAFKVLRFASIVKQMRRGANDERVLCTLRRMEPVRGQSRSHLRFDIQFETQIISREMFRQFNDAFLQQIESRRLHFSFAQMHQNGAGFLLLSSILMVANLGGSVGVQFGAPSDGYTQSIFCIVDPRFEPVFQRDRATNDFAVADSELVELLRNAADAQETAQFEWET